MKKFVAFRRPHSISIIKEVGVDIKEDVSVDELKQILGLNDEFLAVNSTYYRDVIDETCKPLLTFNVIVRNNAFFGPA